MIEKQLTNEEIMEEDRVGHASAWIRTYIRSHPNWVPTLDQIAKMGKRFKLTDGYVLILYDRITKEISVESQVQDIIDYLE